MARRNPSARIVRYVPVFSSSFTMALHRLRHRFAKPGPPRPQQDATHSGDATLEQDTSSIHRQYLSGNKIAPL